MIKQLTNQDPDFYKILGPFLSRREIVNELGSPVWDDDNKVWFVDIDRGLKQEVKGFGAVIIEKDKAHFCSTYVLPKWRGYGTHDRLMDARMEYVQGKANVITSTIKREIHARYFKYGFKIASELKNYVKMEKSL